MALAALFLAKPDLARADGPSPDGLASSWHQDPLVLTSIILAALLALKAFRRLRRRGRADHAPLGRALLFLLALVLAGLALLSPLDSVADSYLLSAHMLEHLLIGDVVPALLLVALRGPLLFFVIPTPILRLVKKSRALPTLLTWLIRPSVAFIAWATVIASWHIPAAYDYATTHQTIHKLEHLSFVIVGLLVWLQLIDPARRKALTRNQRLAYASALFLASTLLSLILILKSTSLYPVYASEPLRLWGISPAADQRLAGLVMLSEQALALGFCCYFLLCPRLSARQKHPQLVPVKASGTPLP